MNTKHSKWNRTGILWLALLASTVIFCSPVYADNGSDAAPAMKIEDGKFVDWDGVIMEVKPAESCMVVFERKVEVTRYQLKNKIYTTLLTDRFGNKVNLSAFKEGKRVRVKGIMLPDNRIIAEKITQISK